MKHTRTPSRLIALGLLAAGMSLSSHVFAQADACGEERDVKTGLLDEPTWKRMNQAYEFVGEEQYDEAMDIMMQLRNRNSKDEYLQAVLAQAIAQVYWAKGDFDSALKEFEQAVDLNTLPDRQHYSLMYQIAQLYYSQERYDEALERLALWFCKVPEDQHQATAYVLQASIHAQKEDWREVIKSIDIAIAMEQEKPVENWYSLKLASHFQLEQFREAAGTLETMITLWPDKRDYWIQLSNVWYTLEEQDKALSVMALAYRKGMLESKEDYIYLANLYAIKDVPFKAAKVMQEGLDAGIIENEEKYWTNTGDSWYAAEEYEEALLAFENAGKVADEGKIDLRRGYILIDMERWDEAAAALRAAIDKGGLPEKQVGEAYLMLGMSEFNRGNYDQASTAWGRASNYPNAKSQADQWRIHMRDERARMSGP